MPTISIITRTRDRPVLLARALRDIAAQTFTDWELILVNDGGDPKVLSRTLAAAPAAIASRLQVLTFDESVGMEAASNAAIAQATGEYLVVHDDDDTWDSRFLARTSGFLAENPTVDGVVARTTIIWERIEKDGTFVELGRDVFVADVHDLLLSDLMQYNRWVPISFLYRRSLHDRFGPYRADLLVIGDYEFHLRLLSGGAKLSLLDQEPLAFWHQRPGLGGIDGNSVILGNQQHARNDALIREEYFQAYVAREGIGLPMFLSRLLQSELRPLADEIKLLREERNDLQSLLFEIRNKPYRRVLRAVRNRLRGH